MIKWQEARRGSVAVQVGLLAMVLIGFAALGTEVTLLLLRQRQMQSAADAAALSAAMVSSGYRNEALAIAAEAGFRNGGDGIRVSVNKPPATGDHRGEVMAVEVIISQPRKAAMLGLFIANELEVSARAVAMGGRSPVRLAE